MDDRPVDVERVQKIAQTDEYQIKGWYVPVLRPTIKEQLASA